MKEVPNNRLEDEDEDLLEPIPLDYVSRTRTPPTKHVRRKSRRSHHNATDTNVDPAATVVTGIVQEAMPDQESRVDTSIDLTNSKEYQPETTLPRNEESIPPVDEDCERRDPPPLETIGLPQNDSLLDTSIERTYTNFMSQSNFPTDEEDALVEHDVLVATRQSEYSGEKFTILGVDEAETAVTEVSKHNLRSKLLRLIPRRKSKKTANRDRRSIHDSVNSAVGMKAKKERKSFLLRGRKLSKESPFDDGEDRSLDPSLGSTQPSGALAADGDLGVRLRAFDASAFGSEHTSNNSAERHERNVEAINAYTGTKSQKFTEEDVERFVKENAASLAHAGITSFDDLYQRFVSSIKDGMRQQEEVLRQYSIASETQEEGDWESLRREIEGEATHSGPDDDPVPFEECVATEERGDISSEESADKDVAAETGAEPSLVKKSSGMSEKSVASSGEMENVSNDEEGLVFEESTSIQPVFIEEKALALPLEEKSNYVHKEMQNSMDIHSDLISTEICESAPNVTPQSATIDADRNDCAKTDDKASPKTDEGFDIVGAIPRTRSLTSEIESATIVDIARQEANSHADVKSETADPLSVFRKVSKSFGKNAFKLKRFKTYDEGENVSSTKLEKSASGEKERENVGSRKMDRSASSETEREIAGSKKMERSVSSEKELVRTASIILSVPVDTCPVIGEASKEACLQAENMSDTLAKDESTCNLDAESAVCNKSNGTEVESAQATQEKLRKVALRRSKTCDKSTLKRLKNIALRRSSTGGVAVNGSSILGIIDEKCPLVEFDEKAKEMQSLGDESTAVRESVFSTETFGSESNLTPSTDHLDDEEDGSYTVGTDGDTAVAPPGGFCSNFLDRLGKWILPCGGSSLCVPDVPDERHMVDYAPELKAVVGVTVDSMGSFTSNMQNPLSYDELEKLPTSMCTDVQLLATQLNLRGKINK